MAAGRPFRSRNGTLWCMCLALRALYVVLAGSGAAFLVVHTPPPWASTRQAHCISGEGDFTSNDACLGEATPERSGAGATRYASSATHYACIGMGILGVGVALAARRRSLSQASRSHAAKAERKNLLSDRRRGPTALAAQEAHATTVLEMREKTGEEKDQFRALCTTLLREVSKGEDIVNNASANGKLSLPEFRSLLRKLEVVCDDSQAEDLFKMLDTDTSGIVTVTELKTSLRSSGVISEMYSEGIQNSLLALIPAVVLAAGFFITKGSSAGLDFIAGYVVEDSLSVDNLFVFLIIFKYFKVPPNLQKTCLDYGIYGAVILRAVFIYLGLAAVQSFKPVLLIFAGILLYAAFSALFAGDEEDDDDEGPPEFITAIVNALPTTDDFEGEKLYVTEKETGRFLVTPLALCIISIELSDILFAVDSVPAVFAVTEDPLIVFTSNIAAILGLRSLYQILSIAVQDLVYLEKSAAIILGFVGLKLVLEVLGYEIGSAASLSFIIFTLGTGIGLSLLEGDKAEPKTKKKTTIEKLFEAANNLFSGR